MADDPKSQDKPPAAPGDADTLLTASSDEIVSKPDAMPMFRRSTQQKILRMFLRSFPVAPLPELYDILADLRSSRTAVESKIERVSASLKETYALIQELEATLRERTAKLETVRAEYERLTKLNQMEEAESRALLEQIEVSLAKGRTRERVFAIAINLGIGLLLFILGMLAGPTIQAWLRTG